MHMQHRDPEYRKINPNMKVPAIQDTVETSDGKSETFSLFESHAIMRYLHESRGTPDHWYPVDPKQRAKVNEYLDWHHLNLRQGAEGFLLLRFINPFITGKRCSEEKLNEHIEGLKNSLDMIENNWLKAGEDHKFLFGYQISIADLSAASEIAQLHAVRNIVPEVSNFKTLYPRTFAWH